jgi:hypothetical protein
MLREKTDNLEIASLTSNLFAHRLDDEFHIISGDLSMPVRLVSCTENPDGAGPDSVRTPFSLLFRADEDNSHPMQHAQSFDCSVAGLEAGPVESVHISRTLRPPRQPAGAYFQLSFN